MLILGGCGSQLDHLGGLSHGRVSRHLAPTYNIALNGVAYVKSPGKCEHKYCLRLRQTLSKLFYRSRAIKSTLTFNHCDPIL